MKRLQKWTTSLLLLLLLGGLRRWMGCIWNRLFRRGWRINRSFPRRCAADAEGRGGDHYSVLYR
jgi:hypothetical protein